MAAHMFATLEITHFRRSLARLHEQVACGNGRIEVTRDGSSGACVLISKTELESLEQALEILAATSDYQKMCREITRCASRTCPPIPAATA